MKPLPYPNAGDLHSPRTTLTEGRVTTGNLSPIEVLRLNDPNGSMVHAGSKARNERGALAVSKFKSIGRVGWRRSHSTWECLTI